MRYDPFARGAHPVGVQTRKLVDGARDRRALTVELYYPAHDELAGKDVSPEHQDTFEVIAGMGSATQAAVRDAEITADGGPFPLVAFSHGFGSDRRQSAFLCTHLASHGYVVCAPDHTGNTAAEMMAAVLGALGGTAPSLFENVPAMMRARPADLLFAAASTAAFAEAGALADPDRLGLAGHSFGGWTALTATAREPRVRAVLPLAPAGGPNAVLGDELSEKLELDWQREVPTVLIAADRDSLLPIAGMRSLFARIESDKRMFVLHDADHMHFCNRPKEVHEMFRTIPRLLELFRLHHMPPFSELCPPEHALMAVRGIALAHFDRALKDDAVAGAFLRDQMMSELSRRGVMIDVEG